MNPSELQELYRRLDRLERDVQNASSKTNNLIENLVLNGLEHFRKYYGVYRATVVNNKDPEKRGRIQVLIPGVGQTDALSNWVDPMFDYAGSGVGTFFPPEEHTDDEPSLVRVFFDKGDPSVPIGYLGGWHPVDMVPAALGHDEGGDSEVGTPPIKRGIVTKAGHTLVFNDKEGSEAVQIVWSKLDRSKSSYISFAPNGDILIANASGTIVQLDSENKGFKIIDENSNVVSMDAKGVKVVDAKGNFVTLDTKNITLSASGDIIVTGAGMNVQTGGAVLCGDADKVPLGQKILDLYTQHTHPTGVGPSGPPIQPAIPMQLLSQKVKLS